MIPQLGVELKTLLGRLGAWPCDFDQETAVALYNCAASNLPANGSAVDLTPSGGKSTVVISAAAFRNDAKAVALVDRTTMHPMEQMWLLRAHKLFKMKDTCVLAERIENMQANMVVVRNDEKLARSVYAEGLRPEGVLFGINMDKLDGVRPEKQGNGWAVWRKPKTESYATGPNRLSAIDAAKSGELAASQSRSGTGADTNGQGRPQRLAMDPSCESSPDRIMEEADIITEEEAAKLKEVVR